MLDDAHDTAGARPEDGYLRRHDRYRALMHRCAGLKLRREDGADEASGRRRRGRWTSPR